MVNLIGDLRKAWDNPTMAVSIPVSGFDGKAFQPPPIEAGAGSLLLWRGFLASSAQEYIYCEHAAQDFSAPPFAALQHLARHPAPACVWVASSAQSASMLGCAPFTSQPQQRSCGRQAGTRRTRGASA